MHNIQKLHQHKKSTENTLQKDVKKNKVTETNIFQESY